MTVSGAGKASDARLARPGEGLFMLDHGDAGCWQHAWTALSKALGTREARPVPRDVGVTLQAQGSAPRPLHSLH